MQDENSLIEFPCDFQIKVIGDNVESFLLEISAIAQKHFPMMEPERLRSKESQNGAYLAITLTVYAESKPLLDALYQDLTKHPNTKMVL